VVGSDRQAAQLASTIAWLEDNLRDNKAQIARLAQQLEEAHTQIWDLTQRLHRAEEVAGTLATQVGVVPRFHDEIASLADKVVRVEDRQVAFETRLIDVGRLQQIDADHIRAELNELVKRVDAWERLTQTWSSRFDTLEEVGRRAQDGTSVVRQRIADFERFVELVDQRGVRTAEALKRVDQEFARLATEIDALRKQDGTQSDRLQVYQEVLKRFDDELAATAQQADVRHEFDEKLELLRTMIRRSEERVAVLEALDLERKERIEDQQRAVSLIETRDRTVRERLNVLQDELATYHGHIAEQFQKLQTMFERQRRRQIEDIEREVREFKVNAYRPPVTDE
jgi:chromosome segregation ATPase